MTKQKLTEAKVIDMRIVIQRVSEAAVRINGEIAGAINKGLLLLMGADAEDSQEDVLWMSKKVVNMRIFSDENGLMNRSLLDVEGEILLISQFTLHASTKKGNRPSFIKAAKPDTAIPIYEAFKAQLEKDLGRPIACGEFGADMKVSLINDGPVTITMDSKNKA